MQDPFTAKIVSRDARDFARNRKIKNQASKEEVTMAITEKTIKQIRKDFDKHNERVLKIYRRNGDKALLELLYLNSDNPEEVAEEFEISLEDAKALVEKDLAAKADPIGTVEEASKKASAAIANLLGKSKEHELYTKVFEYVASTGCEEPAVLAEVNRANGHSSNVDFPENGSWYTFTKIDDGVLYCNYFRDDKSMVFCRIDLSSLNMRINYYFAESDEFYYSLGDNAALVISDSLNSNGDYGVYAVYPFEAEEYRQRAFDLVIDKNGNVSELFNTSDPDFSDIKNYSDFKKKFYSPYLIVNSDKLVFDEDQPQLWDYPHDVKYNSDKGHNEYIFYVWKEGYSEQTFMDLYYKDSYDREELGKHTLLNKIKYDKDSFRRISNPMDITFRVVGLSDTIVYKLQSTEEGIVAQFSLDVNDHIGIFAILLSWRPPSNSLLKNISRIASVSRGEI